MSDREEKKEVFALDVIAIETESVREELRGIRRAAERIATVLERAFFPVFKITQLDGGNMSAGQIKGTPVGGTSTFGESDPAGFVDPSGAVRAWATSDAENTSLTPSPDTKQVSVAAAADAPVGGSYVLTYTDTDSSGNVIGTSGPITVPFLPAPAVDFVVNQLS
jgi:hypothetical protein